MNTKIILVIAIAIAIGIGVSVVFSLNYNVLSDETTDNTETDVLQSEDAPRTVMRNLKENLGVSTP